MHTVCCPVCKQEGATGALALLYAGEAKAPRHFAKRLVPPRKPEEPSVFKTIGYRKLALNIVLAAPIWLIASFLLGRYYDRTLWLLYWSVAAIAVTIPDFARAGKAVEKERAEWIMEMARWRAEMEEWLHLHYCTACEVVFSPETSGTIALNDVHSYVRSETREKCQGDPAKRCPSCRLSVGAERVAVTREANDTIQEGPLEERFRPPVKPTRAGSGKYLEQDLQLWEERMRIWRHVHYCRRCDGFFLPGVDYQSKGTSAGLVNAILEGAAGQPTA